ncbi:hypothetical protein NDU88_004852 [Pleurodeles waltl]|uniref:Transposase n=1 Tax=Pleurodeles waltl TaxID=8319 RepID=A0AAV7MB38_PLEWA|nr:hypothetical protein NDU88_004852 [Pleurodeles waltl]
MNLRVQEAEDLIATLKTKTIILKKQETELQKILNSLGAELEEIEGFSRRNIIRLVPESPEGDTVGLFVADLILKVFQPRGLSKFFLMERVQRIPGTPPKPVAPLRTLIASIFNFRDRDAIFQAARWAPPVRIENA